MTGPLKCTVTSGITAKNPPHIRKFDPIRPSCAADNRNGADGGGGAVPSEGRSAAGAGAGTVTGAGYTRPPARRPITRDAAFQD
ncbi:hypothetical protein GCM10008937_08190 [Deinococcus depolymerans]|uniref:Uncharacterized protein n=1 Tax=Deinococcus depolymerans TaxID=392408 RepID=A0ABN1BQ24_9DEIO